MWREEAPVVRSSGDGGGLVVVGTDLHRSPAETRLKEQNAELTRFCGGGGGEVRHKKQVIVRGQINLDRRHNKNGESPTGQNRTERNSEYYC